MAHHLLLSVAAVAFVVGCAAQPASDAATSADQRIICRTDRELGSSMSRRVCKTASEWQAEREQQQEGMRSIDRQPNDTPDQIAGGGPG